jgi:hypothetical protein
LENSDVDSINSAGLQVVVGQGASEHCFLFLNESTGGGSAIPLDLGTADDVCDGKLVDNKKEIS